MASLEEQMKMEKREMPDRVPTQLGYDTLTPTSMVDEAKTQVGNISSMIIEASRMAEVAADRLLGPEPEQDDVEGVTGQGPGSVGELFAEIDRLRVIARELHDQVKRLTHL